MSSVLKNKFPKGQLILKWFLGVVDFLQKPTNEKKSTWGIIVVKSNSFVRFLEEINDPKNHLEINRPLADSDDWLIKCVLLFLAQTLPTCIIFWPIEEMLWYKLTFLSQNVRQLSYNNNQLRPIFIPIVETPTTK